MEIHQQQMLKNFLENIASIADEKYQERVWVRAEGPEYDDIDDTVGDFFDDGNPMLKNYKNYGISDMQYEIIMKLHNKLREFTDANRVYYDYKLTEKLIKMPEWQEIRVLAKDVLQAFNFYYKYE